jgi:hypothetical protein
MNNQKTGEGRLLISFSLPFDLLHRAVLVRVILVPNARPFDPGFLSVGSSGWMCTATSRSLKPCRNHCQQCRFALFTKLNVQDGEKSFARCS